MTDTDFQAFLISQEMEARQMPRLSGKPGKPKRYAKQGKAITLRKHRPRK
jgi:hypothetical protein